MDPVEEECQTRRAEERIQRDQQSAALVLNRGRGRKRTKYYLTSTHVLQNLDDAILDLRQHQLAQQHQLLDHHKSRGRKIETSRRETVTATKSSRTVGSGTSSKKS